MLMTFCIVASLLCVAAVVWQTAANVQMLRNWKRTPGVITGTAEDRVVQVSVGPLEDATRINVPVRSGSVYSNWDHVTVLEDPNQPSRRRIAAVMDLWQPVLATALAAMLLCISAIIARGMVPAQAEWAAGQWKPTSATSASSPLVQIRPPAQAWRANLFWATILGGSLLAVAIFGGGTNLIVRVLVGWLGASFVLWMAYSAVGNYTGAIVADNTAVISRSYWSAQRVAWTDLRDLRLVDTKKELDKLKGFGARGKMKPVDNSVPDIRHWVFYGADCREVLRIDVQSEPSEQVQALLELARQRIATRPCRGELRS
jgi:hypothetical protein